MHILYRFVRVFFWFLFKTLYTYRIYGKERVPKGAAIIASNHVSYIDPLLIAASYMKEELFFLARSTLYRHPIFRFIMNNINTFPVQKGKEMYMMGVLKKILERKKNKMVIFPEGTRSLDGNLQPFKEGIGLFAQVFRASFIPVYVHGPYEALPKGKRWPKFGGKLICVFGKPIASEDFFLKYEKKEAREKIREEIEQSIKNLKEWVESGAKGDLP